MNCPYCGADNREKAKFCRLCAKRIDGQTGPSVTPEKVSDKTKSSSSKKTAYLAIPILLVLVAGGWIFANRSDSPTSSEAKKVEAVTSTSSASIAPATSASVATTTSETPSLASPVVAESSENKVSESQGPVTSSPVISPAVASTPTMEEKPVAPVETAGTSAVASNEAPNTAEQKTEKKVVKSPPKKEVKKVQSTAKPQSKPDTASSGSTPKVVQPAPQYQEPKVPQKSSFASEMEICKTKSLFAKSTCETQVRAKYCAGKWGSTAECPAQRSVDPSDGRG